MLDSLKNNQENTLDEKYFENVLELRLEINGKLTKILALAPKNCDFVSDIFIQNLISFEKYSQVLKKVNELYSRIETKKIFKSAMKNQINFDLIKKYKVLNRLNHLNQKAKIIEYKNTNGEIFRFIAKNGLIQKIISKNGDNIKPQQKSAIQKFINQNNISKFKNLEKTKQKSDLNNSINNSLSSKNIDNSKNLSQNTNQVISDSKNKVEDNLLEVKKKRIRNVIGIFKIGFSGNYEIGFLKKIQ